MASNSNTSAGGGIGFVGLLTIVFVILKLTGVVVWSWWWVLSPLWISFGIGVLAFVAIGIVGLGIFAANKREHRRIGH